MKVIITLPIDKIKLIQLDIKIVNYVFNSYPRSDKGYKLWLVEYGGQKFTNRECITLNEFGKKRKSEHLKMKILETMAKKTRFDVKVFVMDTSSNERTITKVSNYHLTRDKVRMKLYHLKDTIMSALIFMI